jgi:hypothetical protein
LFVVVVLLFLALFSPIMITHGHVDFYLGDANHIVGSLAKFVRDIEKPPMSLSCTLFKGCGTTHFYEAVLNGEEMFLTSLVERPQQVHILGKVLSPTLPVQLDNYTNDNKCRYVLCP